MLTHAHGSVLCGEPLLSIAQSQESSLYHNVRKISIFQSPGNEECVYELWSLKSADIWPVHCNLFVIQSITYLFLIFPQMDSHRSDQRGLRVRRRQAAWDLSQGAHLSDDG